MLTISECNMNNYHVTLHSNEVKPTLARQLGSLTLKTKHSMLLSQVLVSLLKKKYL